MGLKRYRKREEENAELRKLLEPIELSVLQALLLKTEKLVIRIDSDWSRLGSFIPITETPVTSRLIATINVLKRFERCGICQDKERHG